MKPISFPTQNRVFGTNQEGVEPLPALEHDGFITSVWELTEEDLDSLKATKRLLVEIYTGGRPPQPLNLLTLHENERRQQ